jgi:hypothetical protein
MFVANLALLDGIYFIFLIMQASWHLLALAGYILQERSKPKEVDSNLQ